MDGSKNDLKTQMENGNPDHRDQNGVERDSHTDEDLLSAERKFAAMLDSILGEPGTSIPEKKEYTLRMENGELLFGTEDHFDTIATEHNTPMFIRKPHEISIWKQDVIFPEDTDAFLVFVAPIVLEQSVLGMDMEEVRSLIGFEYAPKKLNRGELIIYELKFHIDAEVPMKLDSLFTQENKSCDVALIFIKGNGSLYFNQQLCSMFESFFDDGANIQFCFSVNPDMTNTMCEVKILCRYVDKKHSTDTMSERNHYKTKEEQKIVPKEWNVEVPDIFGNRENTE